MTQKNPILKWFLYTQVLALAGVLPILVFGFEGSKKFTGMYQSAVPIITIVLILLGLRIKDNGWLMVKGIFLGLFVDGVVLFLLSSLGLLR